MKHFVMAVFLMSSWGMAVSSEPSLADLSKQARERKAKALKPARLITNADLKDFRNAPVSVSKADEEAQSSDLPGDAHSQLLAEWQPKFQAAALGFKNAVNIARVLRLRLNYLHNSAYTPDLGSNADFAMLFEQTTKELERIKEDVAKAEEAIEALKVAARAAGLLEEAEIAASWGAVRNRQPPTWRLQNGQSPDRDEGRLAPGDRAPKWAREPGVGAQRRRAPSRGEGREFLQSWNCPQVFFVFFSIPPLFIQEESNAELVCQSRLPSDLLHKRT